jgi:hypothetical protein
VLPRGFRPHDKLKHARGYKSVHNAKLSFLLTVNVSEALIQAQLWKRWVQIPQVGAGAKRQRLLVLLYTIHSEHLYGVIMCLDVRFVDMIGKQPTKNNFADGGKLRILFAG